MKYIEIDGQGYLVYEDKDTMELFIIKATKIETSYEYMKEFDKKVVEAYYEEEK